MLDPRHIAEDIARHMIASGTDAAQRLGFRPAFQDGVCGFERDGFFYTRAAAARACRQWSARPAQ